MKQAKNDLPTRLEAGGVCFHGQDCGDFDVARVRVPAGADAAPLLDGLPGNLCQCPHWATVVKGSIHLTYADGTEETNSLLLAAGSYRQGRRGLRSDRVQSQRPDGCTHGSP